MLFRLVINQTWANSAGRLPLRDSEMLHFSVIKQILLLAKKEEKFFLQVIKRVLENRIIELEQESKQLKK